jgi:hypothetical protein
MSVQEPPQPPTSPAPPTEVFGTAAPSPKRSWWQRGWGAVSIGVVGLLVGAGIGTAGKTSTRTVTAQGRTTTVQAVQAPARTVTHVVVHTNTVAQTQTATPSESASPENSSAGSYSGSGTKGLGTITVAQTSVIHWHASGGLFIINNAPEDAHQIGLSSKASSGESVIEPGTYHQVQVDAIEEWGFTITPQG